MAIDWNTYAQEQASALPDIDPNQSLGAYITSGRGLVQDVLQGSGFESSRLEEFAVKMKDGQDDLDWLYARIQTFRENPVAAREAGVNVRGLEQMQQDTYIQYQRLLFWAQMVPYIHEALKERGVRAADYVAATQNDAVIRSFAYWAQVDASYEELRANEQLRGLGQAAEAGVVLGTAGWVTIAVVSIALVAGACFVSMESLATYRQTKDIEQQAPLIDCVAKGGPNAAACQSALAQVQEQATERERQFSKNREGSMGQLKSILMWTAIIGAGLIFLPTLLEAGKSGGQAIRERRRMQNLLPAAPTGA